MRGFGPNKALPAVTFLLTLTIVGLVGKTVLEVYVGAIEPGTNLGAPLVLSPWTAVFPLAMIVVLASIAAGYMTVGPNYSGGRR